MGVSRRAEQLGEYLLNQLERLGEVRRYWVAYSGGLDSSVLLDALAALRRQAVTLPGLGQLAAIHVDHGLHPDSAAWVEHCAARCAELAIPLVIDWPDSRPQPGEGIESWGHRVRRALFTRLLAPGDILLLAHHRDDQAETVLLALLRGSGPDGLAAMPASMQIGAGSLFRPFLDLERAVLADYARHRGVRWIHDPSNAELCFDRNYLRHQILPLMRSRWPAMAKCLARVARLCAESAELSERFAAQILERVRGSLPGTLSIAHLSTLDRPLAKAVIRLWIREQSLQPLDSHRLERLCAELIPARPDANPLIQWPGCEIRRYRDLLLAVPPLPPIPDGKALWWLLGERPGYLDLPTGLGRLLWEPLPEGWRGGPITVQIRFGQRGLTCRTRGGGPRRSLKKLFQEAGIPAWLRPRWPLIFRQDQLVAIPGLGACRSDPAGPVAGMLRWTDYPWQHLWPDLACPLVMPG